MSERNYPVNLLKLGFPKSERAKELDNNYQLMLSCIPEIAVKYNLNKSEITELTNFVKKTYLEVRVSLFVEDRLGKIMSGFFNRTSRYLEKSRK